MWPPLAPSTLSKGPRKAAHTRRACSGSMIHSHFLMTFIRSGTLAWGCALNFPSMMLHTQRSHRLRSGELGAYILWDEERDLPIQEIVYSTWRMSWSGVLNEHGLIQIEGFFHPGNEDSSRWLNTHRCRPSPKQRWSEGASRRHRSTLLLTPSPAYKSCFSTRNRQHQGWRRWLSSSVGWPPHLPRTSSQLERLQRLCSDVWCQLS